MTTGSQRSDVGPQGPLPYRVIGMKGIAAAVVAVILVLAGVAAIVIWSSAPSPPSLPSPCERSETMPVQFTSVTMAGTPPFNNSASWEVSCVRKSIAALPFKVRVMREYDLLTPDRQDLRFNTIIIFGSSVRLKVTDVDWNGKLTQGDRFFVYGMEDHHNWRLDIGAVEQYTSTAGSAWWDTMSSPPTIVFSAFTYGGVPPNNVAVNWTVVEAVGRTYEFSYYEAKIKKDGTSLTLTAVKMRADTIISFGSYVRLVVNDVTGDGNLTAGDQFLINGLDEGHDWYFSLIWSPTSTVLQSVQWTTNSPRPIIAFSAITKDGSPPSNHSVEWTVVNASAPVYYLSSYLVGIEMDGTPLSPTMSNLTSGVIIGFGGTVRLVFHDAGGDGRLSAGESFLVYGMGEPHNWRFNLFWTGNVYEPQYLDWTTP